MNLIIASLALLTQQRERLNGDSFISNPHFKYMENSCIYYLFACVAGVIGEGEGEQGRREKIPLILSHLPSSPSPSPITQATQANYL